MFSFVYSYIYLVIFIYFYLLRLRFGRILTLPFCVGSWIVSRVIREEPIEIFTGNHKEAYRAFWKGFTGNECGAYMEFLWVFCGERKLTEVNFKKAVTSIITQNRVKVKGFHRKFTNKKPNMCSV